MGHVDTLVITPTLGERPSLDKTILSVRLHGGNRVNHILVGPIHKIRLFQHRYPWIDLVDQPSKSGVYPAINHALHQHAYQYRLFAYINDDDSWTDGFAALFGAFDSGCNVDLVYGRVEFVDIRSSSSKQGAYFPYPLLFESLLKSGIPLFTQQAVLVKTDCVMKHGCFDESLPLTADSDLWSRLLAAGIRARGLNKTCATYQLAGNRLSLRSDLIGAEVHLRQSRKLYLRRSFVDFFFLFLYRAYNFPLYLQRIARVCLKSSRI